MWKLNFIWKIILMDYSLSNSIHNNEEKKNTFHSSTLVVLWTWVKKYKITINQPPHPPQKNPKKLITKPSRSGSWYMEVTVCTKGDIFTYLLFGRQPHSVFSSNIRSLLLCGLTLTGKQLPVGFFNFSCQGLCLKSHSCDIVKAIGIWCKDVQQTSCRVCRGLGSWHEPKSNVIGSLTTIFVFSAVASLQLGKTGLVSKIRASKKVKLKH